ncbi:small heat shock protein, chloroplastic-like [Mercurialis annua]|uniref:small heat shock protein, chloroplastic-like n=1 Tax=Mercurialis annua TaxID=3986 RepID=UPI00215FC7C0|nr:small heat shock protein, chloroplastic-like [Mercurialis annua]
MASSALRRATSSKLFSKLNPFRSTSRAAAARSFSTDTQITHTGNDDLGTVNVDRRTSADRGLSRRRDTSPTFFPFDVIDPFSPTRTLGQVFNMMDQLMDFPLSPRGGGRGWDVKEDEKALYLKMEMPGLSKEDVKINVEGDTLVIKGEGPGEEEDGGGRKYSSRLQLSLNGYKLDEIKAEMKNGVLKIVVLKVSEDEKKDVVEVPIE